MTPSIKLLYMNSQKGDTRDITSYSGAYSRSDNLSSLGEQFTFNLTSNPLDEITANHQLEIGGKVIFYHNGQKVFSGIIVSRQRSTLSEWSYTAFDYAFYLNKSEVLIQFNGISATDALNRLCNENGVPIGKIANISTKVMKIYKGEVISDVIRDILSMATAESGKQYRLEVRDNKLYIEDYAELVVQCQYKPARNVGQFNPVLALGSFNESSSIEDMKNRVKVVSSSEKNQQILSDQKDDESIKTFGQLVKVETVDDKNESQALQIAKTKLAELNKVSSAFTVTLFGDDKVRAGRTLVITSDELGINGKACRVKSCTHNYKSIINHTMTLELEV